MGERLVEALEEVGSIPTPATAVVIPETELALKDP